MNEPDDTRSASGVTESGPADKRDGFSPYSPPDEASEKESKRSLRRPTRRTWTIIFSIALVVTFVLVGSYVRVPYVALGPGPTYDTLGENEGRDVVTIDGARSYDDDGQLRMTTVSLNDEVTLFGALGLWISGRYSVAPREEYFQPGQTDEQVRQENVEQFQQSQSQAEVAALRALGHPVRVVADQIVDDTPAAELLEPGDELNEVNGRSVSEQSEVMAALENTRPGQDVEITYTRGDAEPRTVTATLTQHPQGQNHGFLGVQPADRATCRSRSTSRSSTSAARRRA
ncbi:PDZ domain-containing protein [Saccharomonospora sp. CUA-673]|uniref:YlbL family protein n=1 Tax=Saccharomonospora sp. CUA-673 TaxID=1904969 RepID=UPI00210178F7|nr:PDZ domain-containing protein [Saccharomonospora sp. CUA-673]